MNLAYDRLYDGKSSDVAPDIGLCLRHGQRVSVPWGNRRRQEKQPNQCFLSELRHGSWGSQTRSTGLGYSCFFFRSGLKLKVLNTFPIS